MSEPERYFEVIPEVWASAELRAAGVTARALNPATLHRVRRGRFADGPAWAEADDATRHRARVLDLMTEVNEAAVVSHFSAAVMHDLELPDGADLRRVSITWPGASGRRTTTNVEPHRSRMDPQDIVKVAGVRVTSVPRTVYDLARSCDQRVAVCAADRALREHKAERRSFDDILFRHRGRPGSSIAAQVMAFADARAAGSGPSQARVQLARIGLPAPDLTVTIRHPNYGDLQPLDFRFRGLATCASWDREAVDGLCQRRSALTDVLAELRLRHLWIGPADLTEPAALLARFSRAFNAAVGPTSWHRRTPMLLPGPGG